MTKDQRMETYKEKVELTYNLIIKHNMQKRVYWASTIPANANILKEEKYQDINRCMHSGEVFKIIVMWILGFIWAFELED